MSGRLAGVRHRGWEKLSRRLKAWAAAECRRPAGATDCIPQLLEGRRLCSGGGGGTASLLDLMGTAAGASASSSVATLSTPSPLGGKGWTAPPLLTTGPTDPAFIAPSFVTPPSVIPGPTATAPVAAPVLPAGTAASTLWGVNGERFDPAGRLMDWSYAGYHAGDDPLPTSYSLTVDVRDYGATGDGVTDDTAAVLAALRDLESRIDPDAQQPGALLLPAGHYLISDVIRITRSNVVIKGAGRDLTHLHFPKSLTDILGPGSDSPSGSSMWSADGGVIWAQGAAPVRRPLADVTAPARRGDRTLRLSSTAGLAVGQRVRLMLTDDARGTLLRHLHGELMDGGKGLLPAERVFNTFTSRVTAVGPDSVTLERALPVDVRAAWLPQIDEHRPSLSEVGVEGLTIVFPDRRTDVHHEDAGFNGVYFRWLSDGWVRDVRVHNGDNNVQIDQSFNVTVTGVSLTHFGPERRNRDGYVGHHGISTTWTGDVLVTDFDVAGKYRHGIDVDMAFGTVFSHGRGSDLNMGHHRRAPFGNLFTDLHLGAGFIPYVGSGRTDRGPFSGAYSTFWNITADRKIGLPTDAKMGPKLTFVGVRGAGSAPKGANDWFVERIDPAALFPQNLHEAQRSLRPAAPPPPPPPDSGPDTDPINRPPTVRLAPATAGPYITPAGLDLVAHAADPDPGGTVARVEFYQGGMLIGQDNAAPYTLTLADLAAGAHVFTATAFDDAGAAASTVPLTITVAATPPPPPPDPNPAPPAPLRADDDWRNLPVSVPSAGTFTVSFVVKPLADRVDGVLGLSSSAATAYTALNTSVRLNPDGYFDARNGDAFKASAKLAYRKGQAYQVRMVVDPARRRYSVYVAPASGGAEVRVAKDFSFRSGAPGGTLRHLSLVAKKGEFEVGRQVAVSPT